MKRIAFLFSIFCLLIVSMPMQAQNDQDALIAAIDTIVRKYSHEPVHLDIIEEIIGKGKYDKNAKLIARIARCYYQYQWVEEDGVRRQIFGTREPEKAYKFIHRALHLDTTCVDAYLIAADIETNELRREEAGEWFRKGLEQCPNSQDLAIAYSTYKAADNLDDAIEELKKKGESDASFNTNLEIARLHIRMNEATGQPHYLTAAAPYFQKCRLTDLTEDDLKIFLIGLNVAQLWQELKTASEHGVKNYPGVYSITSYYYQSLVNLKEWDEALKAYQMLQTTDKYKVDPRNEAYLGNVYRGLKRYDEAMAQYEKVLNMEDQSGASIANNGIKATMDEQVKAFIKDKRFDEAVALYQKFVERRRAEGKLDGTIYGNYANIYLQQSLTVEGEAKIPVLRKAGDILEEWIEMETYPNNKAIALEQRFLVESEIFKVDENNLDGMYTQSKRQIDYIESLPEDDRTSGITKRYENALANYYNYHIKMFLNTKSPKDKAALKDAGNLVLDRTNNTDLINTITSHFTALKIK